MGMKLDPETKTKLLAEGDVGPTAKIPSEKPQTDSPTPPQAFRLPWPPSVNHYWTMYIRSNKIKATVSATGKRFRDHVAAILRRAPGYGDARLKVHIIACVPDKRKRDLDNLPKGILDSLKYAGIYDDDSQIDDLQIVRGDYVKNGQLIVTINPIEEEGSW